MEGLEFGAQGFVYEGEFKFVFPHNNTITLPPHMTLIGHSYPMNLTENTKKEIFDVVTNFVKALEIDNSMLSVVYILRSIKLFRLEKGILNSEFICFMILKGAEKFVFPINPQHSISIFLS